MNFKTEYYHIQKKQWPQQGRVILANYDAESIIVYQAYRPDIGKFAATNGFFGGEFRLNRMSWIKPNFLWMMYRSGWATKDGQETILAVRILRTAFDQILKQAVCSSFGASHYKDKDVWKQELNQSEVRLQWDPDHSPSGGKLERRAIQLGLRGGVLEMYAKPWILEISNITDFVKNQRENINSEKLMTPKESVYPVKCLETHQKLKLNFG